VRQRRGKHSTAGRGARLTTRQNGADDTGDNRDLASERAQQGGRGGGEHAFGTGAKRMRAQLGAAQSPKFDRHVGLEAETALNETKTHGTRFETSPECLAPISEVETALAGSGLVIDA